MPKELLLIKFLEERHPSVLFLDQEVDYQSYNPAVVHTRALVVHCKCSRYDRRARKDNGRMRGGGGGGEGDAALIRNDS